MMYVRGVAETVQLMQRRAARLGNFTGPMGKVLTDLFEAIQQNWRQQGSDDGPWAALKPATLRAKLSNGGSPLILIGAPRRQNLGVHARGKKAGQRKYGKIVSGGGSAGALMRDWDLTVDDKGRVGTVKSRHFYGTYHQLGMGYNPLRRLTPTDARTRELVLRNFTQYRDDVVVNP